jgi:hypothetical protein
LIREGLKTMTRRVIKQRGKHQPDPQELLNSGCDYDGNAIYVKNSPTQIYDSPYQVGDVLYVKESWKPTGVKPGFTQIHYSDGAAVWQKGTASTLPDRVRSPLFMPRWTARTFLEVTSLRAERVRDMSSEDAWDEGTRCCCTSPTPICKGNISAYEKLWDEIHGKKHPWASNPWVWVIGFELKDQTREDHSA